MLGKRILHITIGLEVGGAEKVMSNIVHYLNDKGDRPEVLALKGYGPVAQKINTIPLKVLGGFGLWDLRVLWKAYKFIQAGQFDVIHAHCLWAGVIGALFKGKSKLVWHEHMANKTLGVIKSFIEYYFIKYADAVVVPSEAVSGCLLGRVGMVSGRLQVIENSVAPVVEQVQNKAKLKEELYGLKGNPFVFGFVGRGEDPIKGLRVFEEAADMLAETDASMEFVVVGSKGWSESPFMNYVGPVTNDKALSRHYEAFDVLVIPSLAEGLPLVLLEGMSHGLPVVASDVGGIRNVLDRGTGYGSGGIVVPPGDVDQLCKAMLWMMNNRVGAGVMGARNQCISLRDFCSKNTMRRYSELYDSLTGRMREAA